MKLYKIYGLNGCRMLLNDKTTRYRIARIDIAEEIINNLFVKKVDKRDLNKFSKDLN